MAKSKTEEPKVVVSLEEYEAVVTNIWALYAFKYKQMRGKSSMTNPAFEEDDQTINFAEA
jgi:hypothetical protein